MSNLNVEGWSLEQALAFETQKRTIETCTDLQVLRDVALKSLYLYRAQQHVVSQLLKTDFPALTDHLSQQG